MYFYESLLGKRSGPKVTVRPSQLSPLDNLRYFADQAFGGCDFNQ